MFNRWIEDGLLDLLGEEGIGCIAFSPLAQGLLTDKYLNGIPQDSRVRRGQHFDAGIVNEQNLERVRALAEIADSRGQTLAQLALAWVLRDERVTSALIGASSVAQLEQNVAALQQLDFDPDELEQIDRYAVDGSLNIWATSSTS
jgi:L-glyceraldehyde 3-phosphate reductase